MLHPVSSSGRRSLVVGAFVLFAGVLALPPTGMADKGDCAQPSSTGATPKTSDALTILKDSVGIATACDDGACICDVNGSGSITTSDALLALKTAVGQVVALKCPCGIPVSDDFNDNVRNPAWWGDDFVSGNGALEETGQVLEYTCDSGTLDDESLRPWDREAFPYNADWEVQLDVTDLVVPTNNSQFHSIGIDVIDESDGSNEFYGELYVSRIGGPPYRSGFYGELYKNGAFLAEVVTLSYDVDPSNGYFWVQFGSFGLAGSGGADGNTNWGLGNADRFLAAVYGYSSSTVVPAGKIHGDNFRTKGGVVP